VIRGLAIALIALGAGCGSTTANGNEPPPPEAAPEFKDLKELLPPAPTGFKSASDVTLRNRDTIFEQINGGSVSYLENGMLDALFGSYLKASGPESEALDLEIYRFDGETGALVQFKSMQGSDGKPWKGGSVAVIHEYGVELVAKRMIVRVNFNDGEAGPMGVAAQVVARQIVRRVTGK